MRRSPSIDWGEAPDVTAFYGRQAELETLQRWTVDDRCRLVAVLGMGGIGKTAVTAKFAEDLERSTDHSFTHIIWRSLRNAPSLTELLEEVVPFVSDQQDMVATPKRLLHWLRQNRCLLILDNLETILHGGERAGYFRTRSEDYGDVLRQLAEMRHKSCVMLTSREKPAVVGALEGVDLPVRSLSLMGSPEAAQALLDAKGLVGTTEEKQALGDRYSYSPLALKIVATSIQSLFDGRIDLFLAEDTLVFNGLQRLLEQQFERLTALEQTVMIWLAINREWTSISTLVDDIQPSVSRMQVMETLESLCWRSLLEKQGGHYTQQPVVMEYVTGQLVQQVVTELQAGELTLFRHHALMKTTVKDYIRISQRRLILQPIAHQWSKGLGAQTVIVQQVEQTLALLKQQPFSGYGAGNLLNLCITLAINLAGLDFSHLPIHHGYLQNVEAQGVNFAGAAFRETAFTQTFGRVLAIAFSPDGQRLAASDTSGQIWLWQTDHLDQPHLTIQGHHDWVWSLVFRSDGRILASGCDDDSDTLKLWNAHTGEHLHTLNCTDSRVRIVDWSPDQRWLATGSVDGAIRLWCPETGGCARTLEGHQNKLSALAWCPRPTQAGDCLLATGSADQTIRLWNGTTGECVWQIEGADSVFAIAWSPDGEAIASGSRDGCLELWQASTGERLHMFQAHQKCIWSLSWSPDGTLLASGGDDQTLRIWDVNAQHCIRSLQGHQNAIRSIQWQPTTPGVSTDRLATGSFDQTVRLWSVRSEASLKVLQGYRNSLLALAWQPQRTQLASGGHDRRIRLWDTQTGACRMTLEGHERPVWAVAWSTDGKTLASGGEDQTIRLWDGQSHRAYAQLNGHKDAIWDLAWHPTAPTLASVSHDQTVRLWEVETGRCIQVFTDHQHFVRAVAWSPDGQHLATGSYDQTLRLWDVSTGRCLQVLHDVDNWVWKMAFSLDGTTLATGSTNGQIKLWDVASGRHRQTLEGHQNSVWSLVWHPDGQTLISSSMDQTLRIWRVQEGTCLRTLKGHTNGIWRMALSTDGQTVASCGADETIRFWDTQSGTCLQTLRPPRPYDGMTIANAQGLTDAQQMNLMALGAIRTLPSQPDPTLEEQASSPSEVLPIVSPSPLPATGSPQQTKDLDARKAHLSSTEDDDTLSREATAELTIQLFGGFTLTCNGQWVTTLGFNRTRSLLAFLLLHRHRPQSRQHIAFAIWPDSQSGQARTNLRKELYNLRRHLPDEANYLLVEAATLGWQAESSFTLDVQEFEQALLQAESAISNNYDARQHLERAIASYKGPLLPTFDDEWLIPIRDELHQKFVQAIAQLIILLQRQQDYSTALPYAEQLLRLDPLREATYQHLMQLHFEMGDRATALQIYHQCMTILREELGIDPSPKTQELYGTLLG